jgi:hypothetical protein
MKHQSSAARVCACLLLAMAGVHAHAQQAPAAAADPQAAVPATRYQSVLGHKPEAAADASPDRNWSGANDTVAATNSMSLTMKGMAGHGGHDHAAMQGMQMQAPAAPAMCKPGGGKEGEGMQCAAGNKAGDAKMACCAACPCMDKMGKMDKMKMPKETP